MALLKFTRLLLVLVMASGPALAGLVAPSDPVAGEKVLLATGFCRGGSPTWLISSPVVAVSPGSLQLRAVLGMADFSVPSCVHIPALSPPLAAGTYDATFTATTPGIAQPVVPPEQLGRIVVAPLAAPAIPLYRRLNGNWFDPAAPGTGVNLVQGASGALFAAWLTHPPASSLDVLPLGIVQGGWLVMSEGLWIAPNVFRGPLFTTRAASVDRPWDQAKLSITPSGIAKFTFVSADEVRFEAVLVHGVDSHLIHAQTLRRFRF